LLFILGALAWNADLLASGSRDRMIMLHDTRIVPVVPEKRLAGHRQEVSQPVVEHLLSSLVVGSEHVVIWFGQHCICVTTALMNV